MKFILISNRIYHQRVRLESIGLGCVWEYMCVCTMIDCILRERYVSMYLCETRLSCLKMDVLIIKISLTFFSIMISVGVFGCGY